MIGFPMVASGADETMVPTGEQTMDYADRSVNRGMTANATIMSERSAATTCRKGKRVIGTSSSFVVRAAVKSEASNCYSCCADKIFFDNFESGDSTAWSVVIGG